MTIQYLKHNAIDKSLWNRRMDEAVNGMLYGYSFYLDIVSPGWDALVTEDYQTIMPIAHKKKFGIHYIYPPPFTQQLGVFSHTSPSEAVVSNFLKSIPGFYKWIDTRLNESNRVSAFDSIKIEALPNLVLNLNNSYENLKKSYSTNTKRNIKKAEERQMSINDRFAIEDVIDLFKANKGKAIEKRNSTYYEILKHLIHELVEREMGTVWGVHIDKQPCAGMFIGQSHNRCIFLFSGLNARGKQAGAMPFLIDQFIQNMSGKNYIFDFEGSKNENLARFYRGFGASSRPYFSVTRNSLPFWIKWAKQ